MATYKAEFLPRYYEGRLRPFHAYVFGLIMYWARVAEIAPGLANFLIDAPLLGGLIKKVVGIAPQRNLPRFASTTFKRWFRDHPSPPGGDSVLLWPDTFNDHFHPETTRAAAEMLTQAGFHVEVPQQFQRCGRPLYDYGFLRLAKRNLARILDQLRCQIRAGTTQNVVLGHPDSRWCTRFGSQR
jgi:Fe-S oxidoreductase